MNTFRPAAKGDGAALLRLVAASISRFLLGAAVVQSGCSSSGREEPVLDSPVASGSPRAVEAEASSTVLPDASIAEALPGPQEHSSTGAAWSAVSAAPGRAAADQRHSAGDPAAGGPASGIPVSNPVALSDAGAEGKARPREPDKGPEGNPVPVFDDDDPIYDFSNPAFGVLQEPRAALGRLPFGRDSRIDWMAALNSGLIEPRATIDGGQEMEVIELDIVMKGTGEMDYVTFPHDAHTQWLSCSNCHPEPFLPESAANEISMDLIFRGQSCGLCHDRVAFSVFACERCHDTPRPVGGD